MAGPLPLPVKVAAKVITSGPVAVPRLGDDPFVKKVELAALEKGIHLHWALPDCLTRGKLVTHRGGTVFVLPGVPDLWLVIRFNPSAASPPGSALPPKRLWRAWVVDSVAQTWADLAAWTPPPARDSQTIHTMAGLLPTAAGIKHPGHGILANGQQFDIAMAAYYPESRQRFGFHDRLEDLPAAQKGTVTYAVVGWFSENHWDPLHSSPSRDTLLNDWKVVHHTRPSSLSEAGVLSLMSDVTPTAPAWKPALKIAQQPSPSAAGLQDIRKTSVRGGARQSRVSAVQAMKASMPAAPPGPDAPVTAAVDHVVFQIGPTTLMCHGAVVEVPLAGSPDIGAKPQDGDVRLYPSIKRAMATMANSAHLNEQQTDFVEMLLQDVDSQKHSLSGVVDMPGAVHALSFQSVPGESRWHARIDVHPPDPPVKTGFFKLSEVPFVTSKPSAGYWPHLHGRSASSILPPAANKIPIAFRRNPPETKPTDDELDDFVADFSNAFKAAKAAAQAARRPIDSRLVYVCDKRQNAKSLDLGRTADGGGTKGAGWWLDGTDPSAVAELRRFVNGAVIHLPDADNLFEVPGATWQRPWSPMLVLHGVNRSYRSGFDGRFDRDGYLRTRSAGESLMALSVGNSQRVYAKDLIDSPNVLFSRPGIPSDARLLVQEKMLFDPSNAAAMSLLAGGPAGGAPPAAQEAQFRAAVRGLWMSRDSKIAQNAADKLDAIGLFGEMLDNNATAYWSDPRDPLFIDARYAYISSGIATGWELKPGEVEFTRIPGTPAAPNITEYTERTKVSASIPNILQSALGDRDSLNFNGALVKAMKLPEGIEQDSFLKLDVVVAPLVKLDASLSLNNIRERSGALCMKNLELVDIFGIARAWKTNLSPTAVAGNAGLTYWTDLTPRLPYWSRLNFELRSAQDPSRLANVFEPPICGLLVPDFIEHALEVFDGAGKAIGQLTTDRSIGAKVGQTLGVHWRLYPWVAAELHLAPDDVNAIAHSRLRALVSSILQQSVVVGSDQETYYETGLSAMLRVIDTVRGTVDLSVVTPDRRVRLLGEPILVIPASLELQSTAETNPSLLAGTAPPPIPPVLPTLKVRIGDVTRPEDGVLGCFIEQQGKFVPVSMSAKEKALLNVLALNVLAPNLPMFLKPDGSVPVSHPFVADHPSEFVLTQNAPTALLVLTDIRGGLYAACGALPRKKVTMEREYITAAVRNLEPAFAVGPVMTTRRLGAVKPLIPPPQIDGYQAEFVYENEDPDTQVTTFPEVQVAPMPALGELPNGRAVLSDGWVRVFKSKKDQTP